MQWQEICNNPLFRDIPFKVETNRWEQGERDTSGLAPQFSHSIETTHL